MGCKATVRGASPLSTDDPIAKIIVFISPDQGLAIH